MATSLKANEATRFVSFPGGKRRREEEDTRAAAFCSLIIRGNMTVK
jgi:hypothetical protein